MDSVSISLAKRCGSTKGANAIQIKHLTTVRKECHDCTARPPSVAVSIAKGSTAVGGLECDVKAATTCRTEPPEVSVRIPVLSQQEGMSVFRHERSGVASLIVGSPANRGA